VDYIQNKSDINKILVRIGSNVAELKDSPSHTIADQLPEVAAEHSPREPELDW
jgi:hypothetical protein